VRKKKMALLSSVLITTSKIGKDAYPIPRIDDTLDNLSGSKWFSTLDLLSGYWQVEVEEADREKTAFST